LNTFLRRAGPLTDNEKLRSIFLPVLDGMAYAHNQGILHRDLTPNNIVVLERGDGAVITDWQNAADIRDIRNLPVPSRGVQKKLTLLCLILLLLEIFPVHQKEQMLML